MSYLSERENSARDWWNKLNQDERDEYAKVNPDVDVVKYQYYI